MHAERLFSITRKIDEAFAKGRIVKQLDALISAVEQRVSQPPHPSLDAQVSTSTKNLFAELEESPLVDLPATWRKIMREYDLDLLLPVNLRAAVENSYKNRLVDSDLLNSLRPLRDRVKQRLQAVIQLRDGFKKVGVREDEISPNSVELEIAMPREAISDNLSGFPKELSHLSTQLQVLSRISKGGAQTFRINSISTNDFSVALNIDVDLGDIITVVLVSLLMIRSRFKAKTDLISGPLSDLPQNLLDEIKSWANEYVKAEVDKLIDRLPAECPNAVDQQQLAQNKGPVAAALFYICEKHEKGFNIDVRVGKIADEPAPQTGGAGATTETIESRAARLRAITQRSAEITVLENQTAPILSLTSPKEEGTQT
jgi:hypothetical protein